MKKNLGIFFLFFFVLTEKVVSSENDIYKKIDVFGEVLEKINEQYVDEINQSDSMDSAINGLLQSLDPYSSYMTPEIFKEMQTETSGEFGGLGIEVSMESGVVKVISPIDETPASRAGIKAGDYIVKINDTQVQGKTLSEAVDLMRGPVGSGIKLTVRRSGEKKALTFNIIREIIQVQSVKTDLLEIIDKATKNEIKNLKIEWSNNNCMTIVLCSKGYPSNYKKNKEIKNLSTHLINKKNQIFHAGTYEKNNKIYSNGGRVLNITSLSKNLKEAQSNCLNILKKINWTDGFFRKDIGWRSINKK